MGEKELTWESLRKAFEYMVDIDSRCDVRLLIGRFAYYIGDGESLTKQQANSRVRKVVEQLMRTVRENLGRGKYRYKKGSKREHERWSRWYDNHYEPAMKLLREKLRAAGIPSRIASDLSMGLGDRLFADLGKCPKFVQYKVKLDTFDPQSFDWSQIPMGPKTRKRVLAAFGRV